MLEDKINRNLARASMIFAVLTLDALAVAQEQAAGLPDGHHHPRYRLVDLGTFGLVRIGRRKPMKYERLMWVAAIAVFAVLTSIVPLAGQDKQGHKHYHYQLIDLGTLGGPQSTAPGVGGPALNDQGTVVGCADTSTARSQLSKLQSISLTLRSRSLYLSHV